MYAFHSPPFLFSTQHGFVHSVIFDQNVMYKRGWSQWNLNNSLKEQAQLEPIVSGQYCCTLGSVVSEAVKVNVFILSLEATLCSAEMTAGPLRLVLKMQWEQEKKKVFNYSCEYLFITSISKKWLLMLINLLASKRNNTWIVIVVNTFLLVYRPHM